MTLASPQAFTISTHAKQVSFDTIDAGNDESVLPSMYSKVCQKLRCQGCLVDLNEERVVKDRDIIPLI